MFNLHAKVFFGFWLAMVGIVGAWLITDQYVNIFPQQEKVLELGNWDPDVPPHPGQGGDPRRTNSPPPPQAIFRILYNLQDKELEEIPRWIEKIEEQNRLRIMVFNRRGEEIFDADVIDGASNVLRKLGSQRRRASHRQDNITLYAQEFYRPDGERLAVVVANMPPKSAFVHALTQYLWLRLLLAICFTGLISYFVSRYLTRPIRALQEAARRLAQGQLDTRITVPSFGGDETAELGRDFNSMADQLQQQIQTQKRLLNDVSHELRSPLARMRVALALAQRSPENAVPQLDRMDQETERLDELIGQLLEVPEYDIELEDSVDLVGLAGELCLDANYEAEASGKSVRFNAFVDEALLRTKGDLLKKALENVIRNAVHYSPKGTAVDVSLQKTEDQYALKVCDSGPGIPDDACERIFEPFFRVDEARTRETGGYGLGLHIAKQSVLKHQGEIRAFNRKREGKPGLCIEISLPGADA